MLAYSSSFNSVSSTLSILLSEPVKLAEFGSYSSLELVVKGKFGKDWPFSSELKSIRLIARRSKNGWAISFKLESLRLIGRRESGCCRKA
ncbi:7121_t:CDS:2 [Ambispora leptoticha]|uniref:7121_t:CDS:1 n=1 Tax=Ambispora leptoticha TaxID=144679 RepID=A0A9N8YUY6_9GLOM|nr:7121_t:CDS:2 [Ambispora leptoticha]